MTQHMKHTPGPWQLSPMGSYTDLDGQSRVITGDDRRIAVVHASKGSAEDKANARLIVAAPGFAAGVEQMITWEQAGGEGWWKGWEMLKAAYRKADLKHDAPWFEEENAAIAKAEGRENAS